LQHSLDGRFVYVGDSGDVIDTNAPERRQPRTAVQLARVPGIDWSGGVPVATSTRSGMGYVTR
jgi:hypothetical protein